MLISEICSVLSFLRPRGYELLDFLVGGEGAVVAPGVEEFLGVLDGVAVVAVVARVGLQRSVMRRIRSRRHS